MGVAITVTVQGYKFKVQGQGYRFKVQSSRLDVFGLKVEVI